VPGVQTETAAATAPAARLVPPREYRGDYHSTASDSGCYRQPVAPPPKQPIPPPAQQHTQSLRRSSCVRQRTTPASTQYTTSSSCGSGVADGDGQCDDGEFKLDTAPVVAEAAVERKEVRRVRPLPVE
jgi:hypothetical protein